MREWEWECEVKRQAAEFKVKEWGLRGKGGDVERERERERELYFLSSMNRQHISLEHSILWAGPACHQDSGCHTPPHLCSSSHYTLSLSVVPVHITHYSFFFHFIPFVPIFDWLHQTLQQLITTGYTKEKVCTLTVLLHIASLNEWWEWLQKWMERHVW